MRTSSAIAESAGSGELVFVHLSDIHFRCRSGNTFDLDENLRNELLRDAARCARKSSPPTAVLISGDIAFRASPEEYVHAKNFLGSLCAAFDRTPEMVWCIPGNHDVDRGTIEKSQLLQDQHEKLRSISSDKIYDGVAAYMQDPEACELLFRPLTEYNRFAASFNCPIGHTRPYWEEKFPLNDGSLLVVRGMNSTIISDRYDDDRTDNLVLGEYQIPLRKEGATYLVMSHHPPACWRDIERVEHALNAKTNVQLFGHKHRQRITRIDNTLRLSAGAVHPSRNEMGWVPRYNWLSLRVLHKGDARYLSVRVYPRIWNDDRQQFIADSNSCDRNDHVAFDLPLELWTPVDRSVLSTTCCIDTAPTSRAATPPESLPEPGNANSSSSILKTERTLTYRFFDLPHVVRLEIARALKLYEDQDEGLQDFELFARVLQRACEANMLAELWDMVESKHNDGKYRTNPFRG